MHCLIYEYETNFCRVIWWTILSYSGIDKHKRERKKLIAPINRLPIGQINWPRDILPEFLWIEYLRQSYNEEVFLELYSHFVKKIGFYAEETPLFLGLISDFGRIPGEKKEEIIKEHQQLIKTAFTEPFGDIIRLYPESPASWLLPEELLFDESFNGSASISGLKATVEKIIPGKDSYTGYLRMIPLRPLFEMGKIHLLKSLDIIELLPKYPHRLSDEDRARCESFGRSILTMIIQDNIGDRAWSQYFWRRNFELSPCENLNDEKKFVRKTIDTKWLDNIYQICENNSSLLNEYLDHVVESYIIDLYSPETDEVLLGLFSRIIRLTSLILTKPLLWSYDLSRILLRCLSDTTITYCYLIKKNESQLFQSFIDYGKGKEKLLLLHLQDTHQNTQTVTGESIDQLALHLGGGFSPALIDINLGDWKDVSVRDMANECNLMDIYRIIYDPTSSDIHGTWTSIKNTNLTYCVNPLHRYHRLPQLEDPPIFIQPVQIALDLAEKAIISSIEKLGFPKLKKPFLDLPSMDNLKA